MLMKAGFRIKIKSMIQNQKSIITELSQPPSQPCLDSSEGGNGSLDESPATATITAVLPRARLPAGLSLDLMEETKSNLKQQWPWPHCHFLNLV